MRGGHVTFHMKVIRGSGNINIFRKTPALFSGVHETDKEALKTPEDVQTPSMGTRFLAERRPSFKNNQ